MQLAEPVFLMQRTQGIEMVPQQEEFVPEISFVFSGILAAQMEGLGQSDAERGGGYGHTNRQAFAR